MIGQCHMHACGHNRLVCSGPLLSVASVVVSATQLHIACSLTV